MIMTVSALRRRSPLRILLVEDALVHQKLASNLLQRDGHAVTVTENGQQALDLLEHQQFDLVLMDVDMPVMDGLTATCAIRRREDERGGHTAIVAVTSSSDPETCLAAGMDAYLAKPLRSDSLTEALRQVFGV
jgi:two-component system, sensor histidine kinase and response regulator